MTVKTIVSTALPVDERLLIKKNVLSGGGGSRRLCIVTGTHGDELEGQYVCFKLNQIIQERLELLNGTVEIYPCLNPLGMDSIRRGIPGFDLDMNRIFPGGSEGTMAENSAYALMQDLKGADVVIDIHSSNIFLREVPQVRINELTADNLVHLAEALNMDFIWVHEAATVLESTLAYSLNSTGTPCLVVEMGVGMRINHSLGEQLTYGILNLMHALGMWQEKPVFEPHLPILSKGSEVCFINAEASGVFLTRIRNGRMVTAGEHLGEIVSTLTGEILSEVKSPVDGYLFTIRAYPIVYEGSLIARISKGADAVNFAQPVQPAGEE